MKNPSDFFINEELKMDYMSKEQFRRKYLDSHAGLHAVQQLIDGSYNNGSLIKSEPGDKNITSQGKIPGKNVIEANEMDKRADGFKHYLMDAASVRADEILKPESMPFDKLINSIIKTLPQKVESKVDNVFSYGEMILRAHEQIQDAEIVEEKPEVKDEG